MTATKTWTHLSDVPSGGVNLKSLRYPGVIKQITSGHARGGPMRGKYFAETTYIVNFGDAPKRKHFRTIKEAVAHINSHTL